MKRIFVHFFVLLLAGCQFNRPWDDLEVDITTPSVNESFTESPRHIIEIHDLSNELQVDEDLLNLGGVYEFEIVDARDSEDDDCAKREFILEFEKEMKTYRVKITTKYDNVLMRDMVDLNLLENYNITIKTGKGCTLRNKVIRDSSESDEIMWCHHSISVDL